MAITERYVSSAGGGAHDGTTEADAFTWAEMITDLNTPRAGYRYNVKGNISLSATTTLTGDGSTTSPNIIRGYKTTPGDAYLGRSSGGALNVADMPVIAYDATFGFAASGADFLCLQDLKITGNNSAGLVVLGTDCMVVNCCIIQSSTNAAAIGYDTATRSGNKLINCDVSTASSGGTAAVRSQGANIVVGNRITCPGAVGVLCRTTSLIANNVIYGCVTGISMDATSGMPWILNNTIYGCSGDGIDIVTSTTGRQTIIGNHITDNGGYGIDFNTSTCVKVLAFNRTRDNTSGAINPADDWTAGTTIAHITTDTGSVTTDYTNAAGSDLSLIAAAPGISKNVGYLNDIGAGGTPVVSAGGGSGGGPLIGPGRLVRA